MAVARVTPRAGGRFHGRGPGRPGVPPFLTVSGLAGGYGERGWNRVISGMPVTVFLVAGVCGNRGRAFCSRGEWRCRPVVTRVCRVARLVASARAASRARDVAAVTLVWVIERIALCRVVVNDTWSVVAGPLAGRRLRARAAAGLVVRDAAALARTRWVAVIQAQNSWMTSRGVPERRTGPLVRSPAPVMVVVSSPNVVSEDDQRVRYASRI